MITLKEYIVKDGDSLQMIAQNYLGDAASWVEIAILNDLEYPYLVRAGETAPKTKSTGDTILLPIDVVTGQSTETIVQQTDELLYGSDLMMIDDDTNGGELATDQHGDLAIAAGLSCLAQDLRHRLITPYGSLPYNPTYGSDFTTIIGNKLDSNMLDKAILEVTKCFRTDPRVVDVKDLQVIQIPQGMSIRCNIQTATKTIPLSEVV